MSMPFAQGGVGAHTQLVLVKIMVVLTLALLASKIQAERSQAISYSGRLLSPEGVPVQGQVDMQVKFYRSLLSLEPVEIIHESESSDPDNDRLFFKGVQLKSGIFNLELEMHAEDLARIFASDKEVFIELTDMTNHPNHPFLRQRMFTTPYALKIPVDQATLEFNSQGKLEVIDVPAAKVSGTLTKKNLPKDTVYAQDGIVVQSNLPEHTSYLGSEIDGTEIKDGTVSFADLASTGCDNGEVIKFDATAGSFGCSADLDSNNASASKLTEGTIADARLSDNIPQLNKSANFTGEALSHKGNALLDASMVGTEAGQVVALDGDSKLPAVDGSLLTGVVAAGVAADAVGSAQVQNNSITADDVAADTLTAAQIASNAVGNDELADQIAVQELSVEAELKLANAAKSHHLSLKAPDALGADTTYTLPGSPDQGKFLTTDSSGQLSWSTPSVSSNNIADSAINSAKIANGSIAAVDIASNAIGAAQIADAAVGSPEVINESLTAADLAVDSVGASEVAANAIGTAEMQDNAIGSAEVIDNSLTANDLGIDSVGASEVAANAIGNSEMNNNAIGSAEVIDNSLTANDLGIDSVGASEVAANAIGNSEMNNNAIGSAEVIDNSLTTADINQASFKKMFMGQCIDRAKGRADSNLLACNGYTNTHYEHGNSRYCELRCAAGEIAISGGGVCGNGTTLGISSQFNVVAKSGQIISSSWLVGCRDYYSNLVSPASITLMCCKL